ncbi:peptidase C39-like protein [Lachnotalea glycerini]|uniref:Peptidase C39-like protein n=1 Tax=Lachnotalea glycerini TaxID=1763509 RepID=A0A318EXA9_9FIRM|nr:peptidase C39-like protein [Lachnotalea glycerini]
MDKEGFLSKYTLTAIANIITKEGLSHFVVIFKITDKHVVLGDPAKDLIIEGFIIENLIHIEKSINSDRSL